MKWRRIIVAVAVCFAAGIIAIKLSSDWLRYMHGRSKAEAIKAEIALQENKRRSRIYSLGRHYGGILTADESRPLCPVIAVSFTDKMIWAGTVEEIAQSDELQSLELESLEFKNCLFSPGARVRQFEDFSELSKLQRLPKLRRLVVAGKAMLGKSTRVTLRDEHLIYIKDLKQLRELQLWGTAVTDAGLVHLKGLAELEILNLNDTKVSDAGLEHLKPLTRLKELGLTGTEVTDKGLARLQEFGSLELIDLSRSRVTAQGAEHLRKQLPKARILHGEAEKILP